MTNLPPGFDPGVWGGFRKLNSESIGRDISNGDLLKVRLHQFQYAWAYEVYHGDTSVFINVGCATTKMHGQAAAFANTYAESHGGWA